MDSGAPLRPGWSRCASALSHPRLGWAAALLSMLLSTPSLGGGFALEDLQHQATSLAGRGWFANLFGGPASASVSTMRNYALKDAGVLPWFASEQLNSAFFRPFTSFTHHLDAWLWPARPALMHLHGLVWLGLLVLVAAALYRRMLPAPVAGLATLLFAISDSRGVDVGWLSNRSALIASTFGLLAVLLQDRWVRARSRVAGALAPFVLLLALVSGEYAVGAVGLLIAHALFIDRGPVRSRAAHVAPWGLAFSGWALAYSVAGWGVHGSGAYIDPLHTPRYFLGAVAERLPLLAYGVFGLRPPELAVLLVGSTRVAVVLALAFLALAAAVLVPACRRNATLAFLGSGTLLALVPACAALPADRLLCLALAPGLGLIAASIWETLARVRAAGASRVEHAAAIAACASWTLGHGIVAPLISPMRSLALAPVTEHAGRLALDAVQRTDPDAELTLIDAPDACLGTHLVGARAQSYTTHASTTRVLHGGSDPVRVTRVDERTIAIRPARGFLGTPGNSYYRGAADPLRVGWGLQLTQLLIRVTAVDGRGQPTEATFRYARPLEDSHYRFLALRGDHYESLSLPAVGHALTWDPARGVVE